MRKPEQRVWDTMKDHKPRQVRLERVENGVGNGTSDVHGLARGVTVWFELKALMRAKRETTPFFPKDKLRVAQSAWHREYAHHGGRSYVLVRDQFKQLFLIPGGELHLVKTMSTKFALDRYTVNSWDELFIKAFRKSE